MSWSSARAANSATDGRAGPIGARASPAPAGAPAGALGGVVPGRVVTSPRGATDPSGVVAVPARSGAGAAAGGGGATSAVTGLFAHPATIAAGTSIETASTRTRWFTMIPPGLRWLPLLLRVGERMVLHTLPARPRRTLSALRPRRLPETREPVQRDADPARAMVDLVSDLVERLVQLERGQGPLEREPRPREESHGRARQDPRARRDTVEARPDRLARAPHVRRNAPAPGARVGRRDRLRSEDRVGGVRGERVVQAARERTQAVEGVQHARRGGFDDRAEPGGVDRLMLRPGGHDDVPKTAELLERPFPPAAVVRNVALEDGEGRRGARGRDVLDRPGDRGHVREADA